jgi:putative endonuclease
VTYYLYILECSNNSFYIGYTTDIERRYQEHCEGSAKCKYTRSFPPKRLAACWQFDAAVGEVLSLEKRLKQLSRAEKEKLVEKPDELSCYTALNFKSLV